MPIEGLRSWLAIVFAGPLARLWIGALGLVFVVLAALVAAGWLVQRIGRRRDTRRYPATGELLAAADRMLHVVEAGTGEPSVVFESGLAASSLSWARVQPVVATFARTASYDRAGLGWSTAPAAAPSLDAMLDDLRLVAARAGAQAPVVLVAHSFGAALALAFARRFPEQVGGLVLVDPMSLATWSQCSEADLRRLQLGARLSRRGALLAEFGVVRSALSVLLHGNRALSRFVGRRAAGRGASTLERLTGEVSKLPPALWPVVAAHWSRPHNFRVMADVLERLPRYAGEVVPVQLPTTLPLAILSASSATRDEIRERDGWLAGLLHSRHIVLPETGHWLHLERPEEIAEAVRWCVTQARERIA